MGFNNAAPNPSYERYRNVLADTPEPETKGPGFNKVMGAAFRTENVIGSYMAQERFDAPESYDPSYDPLTEDNLKGYEAYSDRFVNVFSPEQNEALKSQLDREIADRETIARGGLGGVAASMFAGTVDPAILIPVGGTIKKGESLLNIGLKSAYAATAGAGVSEVILHQTQETRTAEESAMAIGGATVLGGILGPTVVGGYRGLKGKPLNGFDPIEYDSIVKRFEEEMTYDPDGDLNASDPEMLARIRTDLEATGVYYGDTLDVEATALEAMVTTLARRTGQSPTEFYEAQGPKLFGRTGEAGGVDRGADVLGDDMKPDVDEAQQAVKAARAKMNAAADRGDASGWQSAWNEFESANRQVPRQANNLGDVAEDVWEGPIPKRPQTIAMWIKEKGGLRDRNGLYEGDLKQLLGGDVRARPGLINNQAGQSIDDLTRAAHFEGFDVGPEDYEGFMRLLDADINGEPVFRISEGEDWRSYQEFKNRPLKQAALEGYEGADAGEAKEWLRAKAKGLDMSQEARMARAREMGFDTETVLYHSTLKNMTEFDATGKFMGYSGVSGISLSDSPEISSKYLDRFGSFGWVDGKPNQAFKKNVMPLFVRGRLLSIDEPIANKYGLKLGDPLPDNYKWPKELDGYDGVIIQDAIKAKRTVSHASPSDPDALVGREFILRNPSNIRSVNAAFDPDFSDSVNLLAQGKIGASPSEQARIKKAESLLQNDKFKAWFGDSKVVDENGLPVVVYHGSKEAGFSKFDTDGRGKTSGTGAFFTESNLGAFTYSGTERLVEPFDVKKALANPDEYEIEIEQPDGPDTPFFVYRDGYEYAGDTAEDAIQEAFQGLSMGISEAGNYPVYLSLKDPMIVDAEGANWDSIGGKEYFIEDIDGEQIEYFTNRQDAEDFLDGMDEPGKLVESFDNPDRMSTDDYARMAREQGYDGLIVRNVTDEGGHGQGYGWDNTIYVAFEPGQIKSVDNFGEFDPANPDILKQGQRGQFDTKTRQLKLFEAADQSTLMHEASHWYLDTLFKIDGNEFVTKQLDEVLNWHGTKRDEVFDGDGNLSQKGVELQEAFAETFEGYLQTGKAPVPRLQQVFDQFREWLTALYKTLDPRERSNLTPEIKNVFDRMMAFEPGGTERLDLDAMRNPQSVGAAAMAEPTLDDYALAPSLKTADATAAVRLNPLTRMATADSAAVREVAAQLMENGMYLGRNTEGKASPISVEQAMTEYRGWHAKAETAAGKAYKALRKDKNTPNMTQRDFYEQVAYAMRRSDQSDNPHVAAAASAYRDAVEKTKQRAIQAGLLPEDVSVKTASSYFHRMWNRNALKRKPNEFKDMTRAWLGETFRSMQARASQVEFELAKLDAKASDADQKLLDQVKELEEIIEIEGGLDGYAKTVADDIFETLMGHDARLVDTGFSLAPNARGPLKERTFNIPDLFEAKGAKVEDYLVNDAQEVMSRYMRVTAADIELTRAFGSPDLEAPIEKIKADYRKQIEALPKGSEKEARRLTNQMKNRIDDLNGVRDVIRGNYGEDNYDNMFARGAELVRAWNYMTMLGGMTVSALPDVGNKVIANGFFGMFRDMLGPLVTDIKGVKIAANEAKELGIAVEMALATRIASLADVGDMYGRGSQFERFVNGLSNRFTYATGMRHWNDIMKSGDYIAATNRAIRVMERPDRANKQAKAWLANLGIGEDEYKRIMAQVKKHGQKRHTMRLAHADKWDDAEAKRLWIGAMGKNANIQTVTPGAGDKMLVMNGDLGKTLGQFKSFAMAANQRVMIRGAQSARMGDARFVSGLATFIGMGMLVYYLKSKLSGRETSDDPVTWVREGVDRSGILPVFMEVFNTTEKVTGTTLVGNSPASRYASRGAFASLLGPSVGRGEDAVSFLQGAFDGELKDRDLHAVRKLMPFNNIFYLRKVLDEFEMKATEDLDLEETSLSERRESMFAE